MLLSTYRFIKNQLIKIRKEKEQLKFQKIVSKILSESRQNEFYLGDEEFAILQARYSPRRGYKYDDYHTWLRGVERVQQLLKADRRFEVPVINALEIACGDGMVGKILADYGHQVIQHDLEDWRDNRAKHLSFIQADLAHKLPIADQQYDLIFSFNSFEHIPDPEFALKEISRVARCGAIIYLKFGPLYNSPWGLHAYKTIYMPYPQFLFSEEFYMKKLKELGIQDLGKDMEDLQPLNKWYYKDFEAIWSKFNLQVLRKDRGQDFSHLNLILKYPDAFRGRELTIDEVTTQWIQVVLEKK